MNVQFKKGALDLCVMAVLSRKDCYGFELASTVSRHIDISEGTVYPLLKRLRDDGSLQTYLRESTEGPPRKYYTLTAEGQERYTQLLEQWRSFTGSVERIIEGEGSEEIA
ncbi:PadR family transcriptional regulator [Ruminococcaceae bacterium OttesenSCG-928-L11]|nr:PadR family transcriptional regulator [Ruminococcaceae bacterium OttesenSCG-928-L11]